MDERAQAVAHQGVDDGAAGVAGFQLAAFAAVAEGAFEVPAPPVLADVEVQLLVGHVGGGAVVDVDVDDVHHVGHHAAQGGGQGADAARGGVAARGQVVARDVVEVAVDQQ